jgi:hypothetical protein
MMPSRASADPRAAVAILPPVGDLLDLVRLLLVAACLPGLLLAPGYAILTARGAPSSDAVVYGPAVTIAIVATAVLVAVVTGVPAAVTSWVVVLGLIALTAALVARRTVPRPDASAKRPLVLMLIAFALLVGFDLVPSNPRFDTSIFDQPTPETGYAVHIANPRVPTRGGDHILQFRAEQVIWHRFVPKKNQFHEDWRFADRTPLVGVVAAALAAPPGASPPITYPGSPLGPRSDAAARNREPVAAAATASEPEPVDAWGFWFYRLVVMALSVLVLLPIFRLASDLFDTRAGTLALVGAGLSPALMLSAYYTSPKNLAAYFGMIAVLLVRRRRPWHAGLAVGGAYLSHPMGLFLGGAAFVYQLAKSRPAALRMALAALPAGIGWSVYSAATGVRSSLQNFPIGCYDVGVSTSSCWAKFKEQGLAAIGWDRVSAFFSSIAPEGLATPLRGTGYDAAHFKWFEIHDFSYGGLVGLVFFALVVVGLVRAFGRYRLEILTLVGVQVLLITVVWGFEVPYAHIAGIGMLPLLFVFGGYGLSTLSRGPAQFALAAVAVEGVLYFASLIAPVPNVSTAAYVLMAAICIAAVGALVAIGLTAIRRPVEVAA